MRDTIGGIVAAILAALLMVGVVSAVAFGLVVLGALVGVKITFMWALFIAGVLLGIFALMADDKDGDEVGGN